MCGVCVAVVSHKRHKTAPDGTLIISGPVYVNGNFTPPGVVLYDGSGAVVHVNGTVQVQGTAIIQVRHTYTHLHTHTNTPNTHTTHTYKHTHHSHVP